MSATRLVLLFALVLTGCVTSAEERRGSAIVDTADSDQGDDAAPLAATSGAKMPNNGALVTGTDKAPKLPPPPKLAAFKAPAKAAPVKVAMEKPTKTTKVLAAQKPGKTLKAKARAGHKTTKAVSLKGKKATTKAVAKR